MERQKKREQIEAIDDEVNELHPILDQVLRKLENVEYVEYTHGKNEMGADFVIERVDSAISTRNYIGVIAKTEKILQNFSEIERQIDECGVERLIRSGKEKVRLPEIWVITSKNVSQNAKIKIADKYPQRKIHFFDVDWLVDRIDQHIPFHWHQLPTATGTYLSTVSRNIIELDAQTTVLHLSGIPSKFIELDIEEIETDKYKKKTSHEKHRIVDFTSEVLRNKLSLLEAEMGYGKSKLARRLVSELCNPEVLKTTKTIPIFQPFTIFASKNYENLEALIESLIGANCFQEAKDNQNNFLLVLDGIDEAYGDPDKCKAVIEKLITHVRSSTTVRVLLTSRPYKLLDDANDFTVTTKKYRIRPLSVAKIIKYIREVCEEAHLPTKLYDDLAKSDLFKQLPQNPIAASLLSNLLSQQKQELPSNLTELYSKSIQYMLGRWDEQRALSTEKLYKTCERLARHLARYMIDNELIYISKSEAKGMCSDFLKERNTGISIDQAFDYLLKRSHIFGQLDETNTLFFRHRSFAEYLYALDTHALRDLVADNRAFHPYWVNVYFFHIGLLTECPDILQQFVNMTPAKEGERWLRLWQMGNYLLAGYQSPYSVTEDCLDVLLVEAANMFLDVKAGRTETRLTDLPEMKLLWLFAMLMKHAYGYEFFRNALITALLKIDESVVINEQVKIYALFFAACALGELKDKEGYLYILKRYKTEDIPISVSLGISCEVEFEGKNFANDPLVKHHTKKLKRFFSTNETNSISVRRKLDDLFDKPIKTTAKSLSPKTH